MITVKPALTITSEQQLPINNDKPEPTMTSWNLTFIQTLLSKIPLFPGPKGSH
jgi:hypothetical protein